MSLIKCLTKFTDSLPQADADALLADYRARVGKSNPKAASIAAVQAALDEAIAEERMVLDAVATAQAAKAPEAPAVKKDEAPPPATAEKAPEVTPEAPKIEAPKVDKEAALRAKQRERTVQAEAFAALSNNEALLAFAKLPAAEFEANVMEQLAQFIAEGKKVADADGVVALESLRTVPEKFWSSLQAALLKRVKAAEKAAAAEAKKTADPKGKKLENTGADLRRHWEALKEKLKASNDATGITSMNKIFAATTRADLFDGVLAADATPGATKYLETLRGATATFKDWVGDPRHGPIGYLNGTWRSRKEGNGSRIEDFIKGDSYVDQRHAKVLFRGIIDDAKLDAPEFKAQDDTTVEQRSEVLRNLADAYLRHVATIVDPLRGAKSVQELTDRYAATIYKKLDVPVGRYVQDDVYTTIGLNLVREARILDSDSLPQLHPLSYNVKHLIGNEATITGTQRKQLLVPPRLERTERKGLPETRKGNITPQQFKDTFNFADVGFGTWVTSKEDQGHLNAAYDAFMDLANHLGVDPKVMGINGRLHFTLGALGRGAKAAATFHPALPGPDGGTVQAINLTKTMGDGTVSHEWFHALDHFLSRSHEGSSVMRQLLHALSARRDIEKMREGIMRGLEGTSFMKGSKDDRKDPVKNATNIAEYYRNQSTPTTYKTNADAMDPKYWGNPQEMRARAFEAWVADSLGAGEGINNYLVNPNWVGDGKATPPNYKGTPYPRGEERAEFARWFKALAHSIKPRENDIPIIDMDAWAANVPPTDREYREAADALIDEIPVIYAQMQREQAAKDAQANAEAHAAGEAKRAAAKAAEEAARAAEERERIAANPPPETAPAGVLSESDLENLFDSALDSVKAETRENPLAPEPGEPALRDKPEVTPPKHAPQPMSEADRDRFLTMLDAGKKILFAGNTWGLPSIQDVPGAEFKGFGMFEAKGPGWTITFDGGGEMKQTPDGTSYTVIREEGNYPYNAQGVRFGLQAAAGGAKTPTIDEAPISQQPVIAKSPDKSSALIAEAAKQGVTGIDEALKGLTALFGGGKIQSFPGGFDEDSYNKAKPHFEAALRAFQAAGKTLKDLFKLLIEQFGEGVKPYAIRFAQDAKLTADLGAQPSASMKVADWVNAKLDGGAVMTSSQLFEQANIAFGGTQADGKYTPKDAYDAAEAGMNTFILSNPAFLREGPKSAIEALKRITGLLPTQTKRTQEQDEFQQFSTVPALAYMANWVANVQPGETMLEPSAGIGGLAVFAKVDGANIVANELSSRRAAVMREVLPGARVFSENAEHINNVLPDDVRPTVVVMNPPFSATAGRVPGERDTMNGGKHIEAALKILAPGGRLVAIVGNGMDEGKPAFKDWWKKVRAEYNVRANLNLNGAEYAKYGTTFDNNLLVIDKTGPTTGTVVTGRVEAYADLPDLLKGVRDDRTKPRASDSQPEPAANQPGSGTTAAGGLAQPKQPPRADAGTVGDRGSGVGSGPRTDGGATGADGTGQGAGLRSGNGRGGRSGSGTAGRSGGSRSNGAGRDQGPDASGVELDAAGIENRDQALTDSVFEAYEPQKAKLKGAKPHPGKLVESAAMAAVEPIDVTYTPNLPGKVVSEGLLSSAQIEAVVYAGQAHQQTLPSGERKGYFIGDGTGVGKGREISGIILDNQRQGRTKHLWVSAKTGLFPDAQRDYGGIGGNKDSLFRLDKFAPKDAVDAKSGIMFLSYDTLKGGEKKNATEKDKKVRTRLDQIVDWVGKDFDGVIAFDEAHNMGNLGGQKGARGNKEASQKATAGFELQNLLPNARIVYVSATGATEVANLMYANRLGLWGKNTAFADATKFSTEIEAAGLASMELVARDMKAQGSYIARSLSFEGVTYDKLEAPLTPLQTEIYDELAGAWQIVLQNINEALKLTNADKNSQAKSAAMSQFWGTQQRFFNQVITSMQTPAIIERAQKELADGNSVVFQLVNTNEATQERAAKAAEADGTALEELDFTPRQTLIEYIRNGFPVALYQKEKDPDTGKVKSVPVLDAKGEPVIDREAVAMREELIAKLTDIRVPDNPVDLLMEAIGHKNVAEVTGRSRRYVKEMDKEGGFKLIEQKRGAASNRSDADAFMAGEKRALIFSDAGGTGYSFHSDLGAKNQQRRIHFLVQPGWRADNAVQGLGRTHRSNEANQPEYVLPQTNLKAQKRFISSIARRLDQLGALTKGQRNTGSQGLFTNRDNLESKYATAALRALMEDWAPNRRRAAPTTEGAESLDTVEVMKAMGLNGIYDDNGGLIESKMPAVPQFLNRLLSLKVKQQDQVFSEFEMRMDAAIDSAMEKGTFDDGMQTIKAMKVEKVRDEVVYEDPATKAQTRYIELALTKSTTLNDWAKVQDLLATYPGKGFGFYFDAQSGQPFAVVDMGSRTGGDGRMQARGYRFNVKAPNAASRGVYITNRDAIEAGGDVRIIKRDDATDRRSKRYEKIGADQAEYLWGEAYDAAPKTETEPMHMLAGVLLPVWDRIKVAGESGAASVVRTQTDAGERFIGRLLPTEQRTAILKNFGLGAIKADATTQSLIDRIMGGEVAQLSNGWLIKKVRVANDTRMEVTASYLGSSEQRILREQGAFVERIGYQERIFLPQGARAVEVFENVTRKANRPVVDFLAKKDDDGARMKLGTIAKSGKTAIEVQRWITPLLRTWRNAPKIRVLQTVDQLRALRPNDNIPDRTRGMYDPNTGMAYVVADNVSDAKSAQKVLLHEVAGHAGLRGVFGKRLNGVLRHIYESNPEIRRQADRQVAAAKAHGVDYDYLIGTEEALADMAGAGRSSEIKGWKRLVAAIRDLLREMGFTLDISDNDVLAILARARENVEGRSTAAPAQGSAAPALSTQAPVFYSALARGLEKAPFAKDGRIDPDQLMRWFVSRAKDGTFKKDELEWSGLLDLLQAKSAHPDESVRGKVTRAEVQAFLDQNGVKVTETTLGETGGETRDELLQALRTEGYDLSDDYGEPILQSPNGPLAWDGSDWFDEAGQPADIPSQVLETLARVGDVWGAGTGYNDEWESPKATKFASYQLPGGKNYRELLLTLPPKENQDFNSHNERFTKFRDGVWDRTGDVTANMYTMRDRGLLTDSERAELSEIDKMARENKEQMQRYEAANFQSGHYDSPNILAHIRFNERTDADGKRVLFIEEWQSDFGQKTRSARNAISKAVDNNFEGIVAKMKAAGALEVNCD